MNEKTIRVLEFQKVKERVKQSASTILGSQRIDQMMPKQSLIEVQQLQAETAEAYDIIRQGERIPFSAVEDVSSYIKRSIMGSMLFTEECLAVGQMLYCTRNVKHFIEQLEIDVPVHLEKAEILLPLRHLEKDIFFKINEHGDVVDDASAALKSIRQKIRHHETQIRDKLQQFIRSKSNMLSDAIITIRNDRYVLPVKHEYRQAVGGIVHDQSSSGQTLFMEPQAITAINNELNHLFVKEKQEIEKILYGLTEQIAQHDESILLNQQVIGELDHIFARALYGQAVGATLPKLNDRGWVDVKAAKHPLIDPADVVANDFVIGTDYHAIVITGPNTGGKTVTLKLIGLFVLMTQAGIPIPANEGCHMAVYEQVFADIGDEQSIEQNLSTFSSHMTNIVDVMQYVDDRTLVLFDELGAGTDPQEGAALAMAILDDAIGRKATVIATTHYPELKAYSYNRESVMNASVEFDVETLRPTYRLLLGVPGRSNAFEISRRLGLSDDIITIAKSFIGHDSKNVEQMIHALEETRRKAETEVDEAHRLLAESEQTKRELETAWRDFERERDRLYETAELKAAEAVERARKEAEEIVASVRNMSNKAWKEHEWIDAKRALDEQKVSLTKTKAKKEQVTNGPLVVGDEVQHLLLQQTGEIVEKKNDKEFVMQIGNMKLTVNKKDIVFVRKGKKQTEMEPVARPTVSVSSDFSPELDLRGERYDNAMMKVEKFIDDAIVRNYPRITIIHGKGTGALRTGIHQYAKNNRHISSFRLGGEGEGGSGVTIIELN